MNRHVNQLMMMAAAGVMALAAHGRADVLVANFSDPSFYGQGQTTYQEWQGFTTLEGANVPTAAANASGTAQWTDLTAATDGAFLIGSAPDAHLYSFSGNLTPEITVPNLNLGSGYTTTVILQVETQGDSIPQAAFSLTADGGVSVAPISAVDTQTTLSGGGFGGVQDDWLVTWVVPGNAANYTLDYPVGATSISQLAARVDTATAAVPEPGALGIVGLGLGVLLMRGKRRCVSMQG